MRQRLLARGLDAALVARLRAPVGLAIGAETPEEIAVSIMAELVAERRGAVTRDEAGRPVTRRETKA